METDSAANCLHPPHKMFRAVASIPSMLSAASHRGLLVLSRDAASPLVCPVFAQVFSDISK